jgi:chemotaxis protein methyltransferase CheR
MALDDIDDYYDHLRRHPDDEAFRKLINLVTITETRFFRDPGQFRLLRHVLPELLARRASQRILRIWSAGCSTGAEAYSIALTLWDMGLFQSHQDWTIEILGTDVNTEALQAAREAVYSRGMLVNVEGPTVQRFFQAENRQFRLSDQIRERVRFEYANLNDAILSRPTAGQDVILCKNVSIYFRPDAIPGLIQRLYERLNDGGYLLLGHSESLWQISEAFTLIEHEGAFGYQKPSATATEVYSPEPAAGQAATIGDYDRCLALFRAGDWSGVETSLELLIQSSPSFVPARLLLGAVYAHSGRYDDALGLADQILRLDDLEPRAYLLVGMIASRQGRPLDALRALRRALYLDESLALAHFWLANLYRDRGDAVRAAQEYQSVVRHWERHTLTITEEFAMDLSVGQLVEFCRQSATASGPRLDGMEM